MPTRRSIVINGDLGSGKTTVSKLLAERLGIRRISVGDLYREMAHQRDMTALELNLHAELDDKIDFYVDRLQSDIAASGEQLIVDSRLAWHFFTDALKVHLITDPMVAARRVLGRPADTVESYASIAEAQNGLARRSESERTRFIERYGVDKTRLRNYDVVCDSTGAGPDEIVERIIRSFQVPSIETVLFIDPKRAHPSRDTDDDGPIQLAYVAPDFFVVRGHRPVREAVAAGQTLIRATLADDDTDVLAG